MSTHSVKECPVQSIFSATFFAFLHSLLLILLIKLVPNIVLFAIPKHKKVVMCLWRKYLAKLHSEMNCNEADHEFNVNESTVYSNEGSLN